jgi:hypothetical protein
VFSAFNFDLLKGMVEEMNRYNETPAQVLKFLNARPSFGFVQQRYMVKIQDPKGQAYSRQKDNISDWTGNPLKAEICMRFGRDPKSGPAFLSALQCLRPQGNQQPLVVVHV